MALVLSKYTNSTLTRKTTTGVFNSTLSCELEQQRTPLKVIGQFINFDDGSKFRKATAYSRSRTWLEVGSGQYTRGITTSKFIVPPKEVYAISSPGGYPANEPFISQVALHANGMILGMDGLNRIPVIPSGLRNEAITKALLQLADQKVNIGENLATLRQTLSLFTSPLGSTWRLAKELKKVGTDNRFKPFLNKSFRDLSRNPLSKTAEAYLRYVYGWLPLMQDIHDLVELAKETGVMPLLLHGKGIGRQQGVSKPWSFVNGTSNTSTQVAGLNVSSTVSANLWARIDPNYAGLRSLNQLGLLNPASLLWEVMPWSFVIDWFLPIGPVLQALTAPAGLIFVDGSVSARLTARTDYEVWYNGFHNSSYKLNLDSHGAGVLRYEGYKRDTLSSFPTPGFYFNSDPLRGDRPLKALALFILSLRSHR